MTLDQVKRGQKVKIVSLPESLIRTQAVRLGIFEGLVITCQEIVPSGPVIISRYRHEIAIGRNLARLIKVEPLEEQVKICPAARMLRRRNGINAPDS